MNSPTSRKAGWVFGISIGMLLVLTPEWTVVVRAAETAKTVPLDLRKTSYTPPENITKRFPTVSDPPIFAIRPYKQGRVALCGMYPQFSFTSGRQWLFNGEVLERGLEGKPSHFGTLLENTLRWLGEPSLASGKLGGHKTDPKRLLPLNERPQIKKWFEEKFWGGDELRWHRPRRGVLYRGFIGIKTTYSGTTGTVAQYAGAARELGLDFIVVIDDFAKLSPAKLEALKAECRKASDKKLWVMPGYAIDNNVGNHVLIFGVDPSWPTPRCLTGPGRTLLNQQYQNEKGQFENDASVLTWLLNEVRRRHKCQIAFYNFGENASPSIPGRGMRMTNLRSYGMGVVWLYRDGKLVEDVTDQYLLTAQGNIPPAPGAVNIVRTPEELRREVKANRGLMFAQARSLERLVDDALRYMHTYDAANVFPSTGPIIHAWPECWRVHTFAIEDFVTGRNRMASPIHVTSDVGLKQIEIYDGTNLFRRFLLNGAKAFNKTLHLNGTVQRNLVLIAEDLKGGKAVSYARRTRKVGDTPEHCGDHCNIPDMFMANGPTRTLVIRTPTIHGGFTWDGGPEGWLKLVDFTSSQPVVYAKQGQEGYELFNQVAMLEVTDEGMRRMRSVREEVLPPELDRVPHSPWKGYGPLRPSKLFTHVQKFTEWHHAAHKVHPTGHAGYGYGYGAIPTLFETRMTFRRDLDIEKIDLMSGHGSTKGFDPWVVLVQGDKTTVVDTRQIKASRGLVLRPGDWLGVYSPRDTNSNILTVREQPMRVELRRAGATAWMRFQAEPGKRRVAGGDGYAYSFATMTFPVDAEINDAEGLVKRKRYVENPTGLAITGATRIPSPGILDYVSKNHRIEVEVPAPDWKTLVTLPIRCGGMNGRWSAGLWLRTGYVLGYYGKGENRYRPMGVDLDGRIYIPVPVDLAKRHHIVAGHPVVADKAGTELFIQVTQLSGGSDGTPFTWYVAVNNPSDAAVTTTLRQTMQVPGLDIGTRKLTLKPGEHRVLLPRSRQ